MMDEKDGEVRELDKRATNIVFRTGESFRKNTNLSSIFPNKFSFDIVSSRFRVNIAHNYMELGIRQTVGSS